MKGASQVGGGGLMGTVNFMADIIRDATGLEKFNVSVRYSRAGDQSFYGIGIPSVGASGHIPKGGPDAGVWIGGSGGGWWWHNPADTVDKGDKTNLHRDIKMEALTVSRFINSLILPFNFIDVATDFEKAITNLQSSAPKSKEILTSTYNRIVKIKVKSEILQKSIQGLDKSKASKELIKINQLLSKLTKAFTSTLYTYTGYYDQDPAYSMGALPLLQPIIELESLQQGSDEAGFLRTRLVRNANKVNDKLDESLEIIENAIALCGK